ncbi:MAG: ATP-binding protein [Armatimonadota bacterium]
MLRRYDSSAPARTGLLVGLGLLAIAVLMVAAALFGSVRVPLTVPLLVAALAVGAVVLNRAALAARMRAEAEGRLQSRLQAIAGIGRLVNSSLDQSKLLVEILRWAQSEIDAEGSSLLLMEPDGEHLRFEIALGDKGEMLKDITLRVGEGIAGTVAQTAEPIIAEDVEGDARWSRDVAYAIDYQTRSILAVPMMLRDKVVGVIEVLNKRAGPFTDHDVQLLQVIGQQSALFLENARLYRTLSDKMDVADAELRRANERLEFEMARIATLVDEMADGVVATDEADRIVIFNNVAERIFGIPERRAVGRHAVTVFDHPQLTDLFARPLSPHGGSYETEIVLDEAGQVVLRAHIALIEQPGQRSVGKCAVFTDISHLKELDRMKMDLISFVSHELKNPIASLQGACRLLHDRLDPKDERTGHLLEIASRQCRRMQYLVQDFLDLSRIEAGQELQLHWTEIADLAELIRGAMGMCRGVGSEHQLQVEVAEDMPALWADRQKLEAVLINLIENAVKYSPEGGTVTVRAYPAGAEAHIEVEDEGVGIRAEDLPKLFKSFQRIHDTSYGTVSGTGVGLYVCRHIMAAHGGDITAESVWGEGSTFRLHLPLRASPPEPSDPESEGARPSR